MKLTLNNIKNLKANATPLEKRVLNYVINEWHGYSDKKHIFTDVLYHGCQSGMVGFLIWYTDTTRFYKQYKSEIDTLLYETMESIGFDAPIQLFGDKWNKKDPLADDDYNQNLLAWFGFEETLRNIGNRFEQLQECI